jgi:predicted nucleic acid-binding protein
MDALCFREWARLMHGKPDDLLEDVMIAATARIHDLILATRNERDFASLGLQIFNPFKTSR